MSNLHKALKVTDGTVKFSRYHLVRLEKTVTARMAFIKTALKFKEIKTERWTVKGSYGDGRLAKGGGTYTDNYVRVTLARTVLAPDGERVTYKIIFKYEDYKGRPTRAEVELYRSDREHGKYKFWKKGGTHSINIYRCTFKDIVLRQGMGEERWPTSSGKDYDDRQLTHFNGLLDLLIFREGDLA